VVCGWRRAALDGSIARRLPTSVANWLIGRLTGVRIHDSGCTLRAYRIELIKRMGLLPDTHRSVEALIALSGSRVHEVVVNHRPPQGFGRSKYSLGRIWKVVVELVALQLVLRFASRPFVWFALLSVPFAIMAALAGAYTLLQSFGVVTATEAAIVPPSIALSTAFMAAYLVLLGLFGELIVRSADRREAEPLPTRDLASGRNDA
jgi:hypothetical protein